MCPCHQKWFFFILQNSFFPRRKAMCPCHQKWLLFYSARTLSSLGGKLRVLATRSGYFLYFAITLPSLGLKLCVLATWTVIFYKAVSYILGHFRCLFIRLDMFLLSEGNCMFSRASFTKTDPSVLTYSSEGEYSYCDGCNRTSSELLLAFY
jgi:hypothetical protein